MAQTKLFVGVLGNKKNHQGSARLIYTRRSILFQEFTFQTPPEVTSQLLVQHCCFVKEKFRLLTLLKDIQKFKYDLYHINEMENNLSFHVPIKGL